MLYVDGMCTHPQPTERDTIVAPDLLGHLDGREPIARKRETQPCVGWAWQSGLPESSLDISDVLERRRCCSFLEETYFRGLAHISNHSTGRSKVKCDAAGQAAAEGRASAHEMNTTRRASAPQPGPPSGHFLKAGRVDTRVFSSSAGETPSHQTTSHCWSRLNPKPPRIGISPACNEPLPEQTCVNMRYACKLHV